MRRGEWFAARSRKSSRRAGDETQRRDTEAVHLAGDAGLDEDVIKRDSLRLTSLRPNFRRVL